MFTVQKGFPGEFIMTGNRGDDCHHIDFRIIDDFARV
jgi:hypothetical protein